MHPSLGGGAKPTPHPYTKQISTRRTGDQGLGVERGPATEYSPGSAHKHALQLNLKHRYLSSLQGANSCTEGKVAVFGLRTIFLSSG
jgi:hypothetical protein